MTAPPSRLDVLAIGECMVELARGPDGSFGLSYGGDTFNTAVYLARSGARTGYATRLGDDPYSRAIRDLALAEGIAGDLIGTAAGRMPGLYLIETTPAGERSFHYWRERAPARDLFDDDAATAPVAAGMRAARLVYLSAITLSLYGDAALDRLAQALQAARAAGARLAMDGNYRPRGWAGDIERARAVIRRFWGLADIALPTFEDEAALWGDADPVATVARLQGLDVGEVVVKCGADGAYLAHATGVVHIPVPVRVTPLDTTAAGDSFNAAYLAARLRDATPGDAARAGHRLAGVVIAHRGAIVPAAATRAAIVMP